MHRTFLGLVLSLACLAQGAAYAEDAPAPKDPQAYWDPQAVAQQNKTGQYQIVCPGLPSKAWNQLVAMELQHFARFGYLGPTLPKGQLPPGYVTAGTPLVHRIEDAQDMGKDLKPHPEEDVGFTVYAPKHIDPHESLGVVVFISSVEVAPTQPMANPFSAWADERRLVAISATGSGNHTFRPWRILCAVEAVQLANRRYKLNPARIYLCGISGGGFTTCMTLGLYSDVFTGACPIVGTMWPSCMNPNVRMAVLEGEKDFNREGARGACEKFFKKFLRHYTYIEQPGLGHEIPAAPYRAQVLDFWDQPMIQAAPARWKSIQKEVANPALRTRNLDTLLEIRPAMHVKEWGAEALQAYKDLSAQFSTEEKAVDGLIVAGDWKGAQAALTKLEDGWGRCGKASGKKLRVRLKQAQDAAGKTPH